VTDSANPSTSLHDNVLLTSQTPTYPFRLHEVDSYLLGSYLIPSWKRSIGVHWMTWGVLGGVGVIFIEDSSEGEKRQIDLYTRTRAIAKE
jgi:hypothetical protein